MMQNTELASSQPHALLAEDLRKAYGTRQALRGLSFALRAGRILGFLGPNGAGKTTAIRILTTMLEPSAGHFFVDGVGSDRPAEIRRRIGVLPESLGFPKQITAADYLAYYGRLYGLPAGQARTRSSDLLEEVGLQRRAKSLIGTYSRGMRQRLGIARALVHDPAVVFLDEPTLGLDPQGQQELLALVRRIARERNAGVVFCSHTLPEIEILCDDVVILSEGQVVAAGTVAEVVGRAGGGQGQASGMRIQVPAAAAEQARQLLAALPPIAAVAAGEPAGWLRVELLEARLADGQLNNTILSTLIQAAIPILSFESAGERLQDVFFHLTGEVSR